jgi:hypothetical protein
LLCPTYYSSLFKSKYQKTKTSLVDCFCSKYLQRIDMQLKRSLLNFEEL